MKHPVRCAFGFLLFAFCFLRTVSPVRADYVLPYPSFMPGNKLYRISRLVDEVKKYWYWGRIGQIKYHMMLSDKYLVEAKTLFEYKQYLLAVDALERSNDHFKAISHTDADLINEESLAHRQVLEKLRKESPEQFQWTPERKNSTILPIAKLLEDAIATRAL